MRSSMVLLALTPTDGLTLAPWLPADALQAAAGARADHSAASTASEEAVTDLREMLEGYLPEFCEVYADDARRQERVVKLLSDVAAAPSTDAGDAGHGKHDSVTEKRRESGGAPAGAQPAPATPAAAAPRTASADTSSSAASNSWPALPPPSHRPPAGSPGEGFSSARRGVAKEARTGKKGTAVAAGLGSVQFGGDTAVDVLTSMIRSLPNHCGEEVDIESVAPYLAAMAEEDGADPEAVSEALTSFVPDLEREMPAEWDRLELAKKAIRAVAEAARRREAEERARAEAEAARRAEEAERRRAEGPSLDEVRDANLALLRRETSRSSSVTSGTFRNGGAGGSTPGGSSAEGGSLESLEAMSRALAAAEKAEPTADPAALSTLLELRPSVSREIAASLLMRRCVGNIEEAGRLILDDEAVASERAYLEARAAASPTDEAEQEAALRRRLLQRYDEMVVEVDGRPVTYRPTAQKVFGGKLPAAGKRKKRDTGPAVRYHDNKVVTTKGEKFVTEARREEDPSTFISLKIKTKGKRGKGYR